MNESIFILSILILVSACLYSMVGHGGASAYLAILSFYNLANTEIRPLALMLNMVVSAIAFYQFYRQSLFDKRIFLFLCLTSIPASFIGGSIVLEQSLYKYLLGAALLVTAFRFIFPMNNENQAVVYPNPIVLLLIGAIIGFVSGLIGIGGGVLLTPLLILLRYVQLKTASGISALFIFVNSLAGLMGQGIHTLQWDTSEWGMVGFALIGGLIGSYIGSHKMDVHLLKRVLAIVLIIASIKLFIQ